MPPRCEVLFDSAVVLLRRSIVSALIIGGLSASTLTAQISPGPLSRAHSNLEGAINCTKCHQPGSRANLICLECHTEISTRVANGRGYHARVVDKNSGSKQCATCHSEHNGLDFRLIAWQPSQSQFDHSKTGWQLDGKHSGIACSKCHNEAHIAAAERSAIRVKDPNRTYLGLSTSCVACHTDEHGGQLGQDCRRCHNTTDWKTAAGQFDHSKARFQLTGAHVNVACQKCHIASGPERKPKWKGLAFQGCTSCHKDPHRGAFAVDCQNCHTTRTWKSVSAVALSGTFDHNKTKFPLLGKHSSVACTKCHAGGDFKRPISFAKCSDCHRPNPHGTQFAARADRGECSSCHLVDGWKPAKFGLIEHAQTGYPLEGRHIRVECGKCHKPAGVATQYKIKFAQCTDCHRDVHAGQFKNPPNSNRCESCHTVNGFQPSTFTLARHRDTRFPLSGAHIAVACGDCHKKDATAGNVSLYRFTDLSCTGCHRDPHRGQFTTRMEKKGTDGQTPGCLACHTLETWKDISKFDHSTTRFGLVGSHRAVACGDCHKPPKLEVTLLNVDFGAAPERCEECHEDPHATQFVRNGLRVDCASCHNSNKWKPSLFDHNTRTQFKLEGVHAKVRCTDCHKSTREVAGKTVLFYKPTPSECAACHGPEVLKKGTAQ